MKINSNLSSDEIDVLRLDFYKYFESGYTFEEFLREYLVAIGLDEVEVTRKTRDGGVDIKAIRKGVGDFSEIDTTNYYIQAKRYEISKSVSVKEIRQLRGTLISGQKGIFITTSKFSKDAVDDAKTDLLRPVVLIDGEALILSCIDNQIGFVYKPIFSTREMDKFSNKNERISTNQNNAEYDYAGGYIEKLITANDIRARIISIPSTILYEIDDAIKKIDVKVNGIENFNFTINRVRNYFGGVIKLMRNYGLLTEDGVAYPKNSKWFYDKENKCINIYIEE
jgi:restriction system protein